MTNLAVHLMSFLDRNIGRCPRCMKSAFICAVASWPLYGTLLMLQPGAVLAEGAILLPLGLSALWLAHVGTYGTRVLRTLRLESRNPAAPPAIDRRQGMVTRRNIFWLLGNTAVITATASLWLPSIAFARAAAPASKDGKPTSSTGHADDASVQTAQNECPPGFPIDCQNGNCCPADSSCCDVGGCCPTGYPHRCGSRCYATLEGAQEAGCSFSQISICGVAQ